MCVLCDALISNMNMTFMMLCNCVSAAPMGEMMWAFSLMFQFFSFFFFSVASTRFHCWFCNHIYLRVMHDVSRKYRRDSVQKLSAFSGTYAFYTYQFLYTLHKWWKRFNIMFKFAVANIIIFAQKSHKRQKYIYIKSRTSSLIHIVVVADDLTALKCTSIAVARDRLYLVSLLIRHGRCILCQSDQNDANTS